MTGAEALEVIRDWQPLVGALLVSAILLLTVGVALGGEWRHRTAEAGAMRIALGTEFRAIAQRALAVQEEVLKLLPPANPNLITPPRTLRDLQSVMHFPEALIYSHAGAGVGALGRHTLDVVAFYNELWRIRDEVLNLWTSSAVERQHVSVPASQLIEIADSLLKAVDSAASVLSRLAGGRDSSTDAAFVRDVAGAKERLAGLRRTFSFRP